jgi:hypothetical protein
MAKSIMSSFCLACWNIRRATFRSVEEILKWRHCPGQIPKPWVSNIKRYNKVVIYYCSVRPDIKPILVLSREPRPCNKIDVGDD